MTKEADLQQMLKLKQSQLDLQNEEMKKLMQYNEDMKNTFVQTCTLLNAKISNLQTQLRNARQALDLWEEVDAYVRKHDEIVIGESVTAKTLKFIKERDEFFRMKQ